MRKKRTSRGEPNSVESSNTPPAAQPNHTPSDVEQWFDDIVAELDSDARPVDPQEARKRHEEDLRRIEALPSPQREKEIALLNAIKELGRLFGGVPIRELSTSQSPSPVPQNESSSSVQGECANLGCPRADEISVHVAVRSSSGRTKT